MRRGFGLTVFAIGAALAAAVVLSTPGVLAGERAPSAEFVRVSPRDPRYLELSDGTPYIPIGLNMIAPPRGDWRPGDPGLAGMEEWIGSLAASGGNFIRVWLGHPFFDVEHRKSGEYDPDRADRIDELLRIASRHGVRVKMCIESFRHFGTRDQAWSAKPLHLIANGGPARDIADFFDGERSREQFRRKLAWLGKRFGGRPEVFGWELWNEIDAVAGGDVLVWTEAMLPELHRVFPRNLALQSLGSYDMERKRETYRRASLIPGNDVAQVHRYLDLGANLEVCRGPVDVLAADAVRELLAFRPRRPVLLAESGAVEPRHTGPFKLYERDREGIILHDVLFAPFFAGAAGPGHIWHWDRYVAKNALWRHFERFAEAVKGLDPAAERFEPSMIHHDRLRAYSLEGRRHVLLWCRDSWNDWRAELERGEPPEPVRSATLWIPGFVASSRRHLARIYDPWEDRWEDREVVGGRLVLPEFRRSIVVRISRAGEEIPFDVVERRFRELPMGARRLTGPLFWLHGDESRERLEEYVAKVAEGGHGSFTAESRPHRDWLGEGWYRDLRICLEAAKRHDLLLWIFDEKWWPSGEVGGKVPPRFGEKRLAVAATSVVGPTRYERAGLDGAELVAVLAGREASGGPEGKGGIDGASLIDLNGSIRDGTLVWDVPEGRWQVMVFTWKLTGGRVLIDGASRDSVDWYLETVYKPHHDRFREEFGKTIVGYFYDEPETHADWGTEVRGVLEERGVDWKRALVAWKLRLAGEEHVAARYQYQDAFAEAWGRTLYGALGRWCEERGVQSIGHFLEHGLGYLSLDLCAGNMFQLQKHSSMGGIDAVFRQFAPGRRATRDQPVWQTPKLGSSISHAYGKADDVAMVEIYGARGQDLTYPEMKWWADHMHVSGVSFLIPHSFNPRAPRDTDCPPYFYNGGYEARWPLYRVFADWTSRLSEMLTGGRHVCPVALLFLGGSRHVGRSVPPDELSGALQDALFDCDWLPYEVLENDAEIQGPELRLREERYRVLVVPPVEVIPYATLERVRDFFEAGGIVVGYGFLPSRSATLGKGSSDIAALREAIWGDPRPGLAAAKRNEAGGRAYLLPEAPTPEELRKALSEDAGVRPTLEVVEGKTGGWLHVLHRVKSGRDVFFIANQNLEGRARAFTFSVEAAGSPECWDPLRNEILDVPFRRDGDRAVVSLTLEPLESLLLVFQPTRRDLARRIDPAWRDPPREAAAYPVLRGPTPDLPKPPPLDVPPSAAERLEGCSWIWYPEGDPASSAPPGRRFFRKRIELPAGRAVRTAALFGTADNGFVLFTNGEEVGRGDDSSEGWRNPVEIDLKERLHPGSNQLAVEAVNATDLPNPAGLIGTLVVRFETGDPLVVRMDGSWKASSTPADGWADAAFDDAEWPAAKEVAPFGAGPWGRLAGGALTLSPVEADPFWGHVDLPAEEDLSGRRAVLEIDSLAPEAAGRVNVNGRYAGGFIGRPLRLDVTRLLDAGKRNEIRIEPFAPSAARLVIYPR